MGCQIKFADGFRQRFGTEDGASPRVWFRILRNKDPGSELKTLPANLTALTFARVCCSDVKEKKRKEQEEKKKNAPKAGAAKTGQAKVKAPGGAAMKPARASAPGKMAAR